MVVSLEMVLPGLVGYWVDSKLGTVALFLVLGVLIGTATAARHLWQMLKADRIKR
jgi:hypothetical protein